MTTLINLNALYRYSTKVMFFTSLANKLIEANQNDFLPMLIEQLERLVLLILDELGYIPSHKESAELLFQVMSMCYENKSLVDSTNFQFEHWNHVFGDPILTETVINQLTHHSHLLLFNGESFSL